MNLHHRWAMAIVLFVAATVSAAEKTYYLPMQGHLTVNVPDGWTAEFVPDKWAPPTVRLTRIGDQPAVLTLKPKRPEGDAVPSNDEVSLLSSLVFKPLAARSAETKNKSKEWTKFDHLEGPVYGVFASYTEAEPKNFTHVTGGLIRVGKELIETYLQHNGKEAPVKEEAKAILTGLTLAASKPVIMRLDTFERVRIDGRWKPSKTPDNVFAPVQEWHAADESRGLKLVARFEPPQDGAEHLAAYKAKLSGAGVTDIKEGKTEYYPTLEYTKDGETHLVVLLVANKKWIDVDVSKAGFKEETDRTAMNEIAGSVGTFSEGQKQIKKKMPANKPIAPKPAPTPKPPITDDDF